MLYLQAQVQFFTSFDQVRFLYTKLQLHQSEMKKYTYTIQIKDYQTVQNETITLQ